MDFPKNTKYLIIGAVVLLLIFALYSRNDYPIHNMGNVVMDMVTGSDSSGQSIDESNKSLDQESRMSIDELDMAGLDESPENNIGKYLANNEDRPRKSEWLCNKFNSRNKAKRGTYKKSSYDKGQRGNLGPSDWDDYFDDNNNVIGNSQTGDNNNFMPVDETSDTLAIFKQKGRSPCGSNQECDPEDLFDVDKYLPQEVNDDWFEVQPEPVSVKNRHLINITKPVGINSIGTSLKNSSYDVRGAPTNPKTVVSPFLNSSIEPDLDLKPLF